MQNYVNDGETITATAPYDVVAGAGALISAQMFGIAAEDITSGSTGDFCIEGIFDLKRETGGSSAWTEGAYLYWDNSNKRVTKTDTSNTKIGVGVLPLPADGDVTGRVRLHGHI